MTEQTQNPEMQFRVRAPFSVHRQRIIERSEGDRKFREPRVASFWPGDVVGLTNEEAARHQHAIDGTDEASRAWLEARYHKPKAAEPAIDQAQLDAFIAAAIDRAIAAARNRPPAK